MTPDVYFHGTTAAHRWSIEQNGLIQGAEGDGVSLAATEEWAVWFARLRTAQHWGKVAETAVPNRMPSRADKGLIVMVDGDIATRYLPLDLEHRTNLPRISPDDIEGFREIDFGLTALALRASGLGYTSAAMQDSKATADHTYSRLAHDARARDAARGRSWREEYETNLAQYPEMAPYADDLLPVVARSSG